MDTTLGPIIQEYTERARKARDEYRYQDILDIYAEADGKKIFHPVLLEAKAYALIGLKRYREAQELLEKSLEEYPHDPILHYDMANLYFARNRRNHGRGEASKVLELLAELDPDEIDERLLYVKGGSLIKLRRYGEAVRFLEYEMSRFPESAPLHTQLALAYIKTLHFIKAVKQAKLIPGEHNRYIRRRLIRLPVSLILYLMIVIGFIVYNHISHGHNFQLPFTIFILLSFIVVMINRPKLTIPPDRSSKKRDTSIEREDGNTKIDVSHSE